MEERNRAGQNHHQQRQPTNTTQMSGDKNYRVYGDNSEPITIEDETIIPPVGEGYTDTLKFSHVFDGYVNRCVIVGGSEDVIDMNRGCKGIVVEDCMLSSRGKYVLTIKDCDSVVISKSIVGQHGSETDIDIGNWTDTSTRKTKSVLLENVTSADGKPVKVRVGHADWPEIKGGNCKIDYLASYLLKAYWWAKYLWTKITK